MLTKDLALDACELKFARNGKMSFEGYASVFGGVDSYGDTIAKGAYLDTLKSRKRPVVMLYGHNPGRLVGKWVDLDEDEKGLFVKGELTPGNTESENAYASMKHGALSGLSIGFRPVESEDTDKGRLLKKIDLIEISLVSMPADADAQIDPASIKSAIEAITTIREAETFLRDVGNLSGSAAGCLLARIKSITQGDPEQMAQLQRDNEQLRKDIGVLRGRELASRVIQSI